MHTPRLTCMIVQVIDYPDPAIGIFSQRCGRRGSSCDETPHTHLHKTMIYITSGDLSSKPPLPNRHFQQTNKQHLQTKKPKQEINMSVLSVNLSPNPSFSKPPTSYIYLLTNQGVQSDIHCSPMPSSNPRQYPPLFPIPTSPLKTTQSLPPRLLPPHHPLQIPLLHPHPGRPR